MVRGLQQEAFSTGRGWGKEERYFTFIFVLLRQLDGGCDRSCLLLLFLAYFVYVAGVGGGWFDALAQPYYQCYRGVGQAGSRVAPPREQAVGLLQMRNAGGIGCGDGHASYESQKVPQGFQDGMRFFFCPPLLSPVL